MNIDNSREPVNAKNSNLAGSDFSNVNLAQTRFDNVNLQQASFNNVNMSNVHITDANTTGMTINDVAISGLIHAACGHKGNFDAVMPVLRVTDMQRSIDWYTSVIGFRLLWRKPGDGGGENCMLRDGAITMMLSTGAHLGGKPAFTGTLYFNMQSVEVCFARIKDKVTVVWSLEQMIYGTLEFGIRDPDGYTLAFAELRAPD